MRNQNEFDLACGHHIRLVALDQSFTYEGQLEGLPTQEGNRKRLEWWARELPKRAPHIGHIMFPPAETIIPWEEEEPYPFGTPAHLPGIRCVARFKSFKPARNPHTDFSHLVVIWFQEEFAFPIDASIREQIVQLDWAALATDDEH